jgi:hypothetical protein
LGSRSRRLRSRVRESGYRVRESGYRVRESGYRVRELGSRVRELVQGKSGCEAAAPTGRRRPRARIPGLRAGEPIFCKTHTNEFCGIGKSTQEPAGPCAPLDGGRRVYEKGAGRASAPGREQSHCEKLLAGFRAAGGGLQGSLLVAGYAGAALGGREPASPFFAKRIQMSFAGLENPPKSPPARARHWTAAGGYMREREARGPCGVDVEAEPWHHSTAAFTGRCWSQFIHRRSRAVPYGLPGYRRLRRAPPQHRGWARLFCPGTRGIWEDSVQAQGNTPCAPRGGLCGCLAVRQTFLKPPGVPTGWGRRNG